ISSRRAPRATRISSVSAALREVLGATRVALASLAEACLAGVVLVSAGFPIVAPLAALSAAIGGAWSVVLSGGVGTDAAGVVPTAFPSDTGPADLAGLVPATGVTGLVAASAFFAGVRFRADGAAVIASDGSAVIASAGAAVMAAGGAAVIAAVAFAVVFLAGVAFAGVDFAAVTALTSSVAAAVAVAVFLAVAVCCAAPVDAGVVFLPGAAFDSGAAFETGEAFRAAGFTAADLRALTVVAALAPAATVLLAARVAAAFDAPFRAARSRSAMASPTCKMGARRGA